MYLLSTTNPFIFLISFALNISCIGGKEERVEREVEVTGLIVSLLCDDAIEE